MDYFKLYSNCIFTKGINRSLICDTHNKQVYFIPNPIHALVLRLKVEKLNHLEKELSKENVKTLKEYINYFIDEGIGFYCDNPEYFPDLNLEYASPEVINNAIIDLNKDSLYETDAFIGELNDLGCKFIEIRCYDSISIDKIEKILDKTTNGYYRNIDLIYKYPLSKNELTKIRKLLISYPILGNIVLHSAPKISIANTDRLTITEKIIVDSKCCGKISQNYFSIDLKTISESQHYNSCLNKKIAIDVKGEIKNCPSMTKKFANVSEAKISDILRDNNFTKQWSIKKDEIKDCKDCEFRYICTDCRAYVEDPKDKFSKPLKCGYNPNTNEWKEWSKNPIKKAAIKYYSLENI